MPKTMLLVGLAVAVSAFPITELKLSTADFQTLNSSTTTPSAKNLLGNKLVAAALRPWFGVAKNMVAVLPHDVELSGAFPDKELDSSCSHRIDAKGTNYDMTTHKDSYLNGSVTASIAEKRASVFAEAHLDETITVGTNVHVYLGAKVFGKCIRGASTGAGVSITSTGNNLIAAELDATKFKLAVVNGTLSLVFDVAFSLKAELLSWDVQAVSASGACKLKILGIQIYNVCGWVADELKGVLDPLVKTITSVQGPKLLQRIADKVNAAIGDQVVIPLKL